MCGNLWRFDSGSAVGSNGTLLLLPQLHGGVARCCYHYCETEQPVAAAATLVLSVEFQRRSRQVERLITAAHAPGASAADPWLPLLLRLHGEVARRCCCYCFTEQPALATATQLSRGLFGGGSKEMPPGGNNHHCTASSC